MDACRGEGALRGDARRMAAAEGRDDTVADLQLRSVQEHRTREGRARGRSWSCRRNEVRDDLELQKEIAAAELAVAQVRGRDHRSPGSSRTGLTRTTSRDRRQGTASRSRADGGRDREARAHGGAPAPGGDRPGRGGRGRAAALRRCTPGSRTRTGRSARSCSSARRASARRNSRAPWRNSCSTARTR